MSDKQTTDRQTGRTTRQMLAAPQGSTFVWCNDIISYAQNLARKHGRTDLRIVGASALHDGARRLRGLRSSQVVIDHALRVTERNKDGLGNISRSADGCYGTEPRGGVQVNDQPSNSQMTDREEEV